MGSAADPGVEIERARLAFAAALRAGDAGGAAAIYAVDATLVAPATDVLRGRAAIERFWRTGVETGIREVELEPVQLRPLGDVALEIGRYALRLTPEGGAVVVDRGKYLVVHRVEADGSWRRAAEMFGPDEPDGIPAHWPGGSEAATRPAS